MYHIITEINNQIIFMIHTSSVFVYLLLLSKALIGLLCLFMFGIPIMVNFLHHMLLHSKYKYHKYIGARLQCNTNTSLWTTVWAHYTPNHISLIFILYSTEFYFQASLSLTHFPHSFFVTQNTHTHNILLDIWRIAKIHTQILQQ